MVKEPHNIKADHNPDLTIASDVLRLWRVCAGQNRACLPANKASDLLELTWLCQKKIFSWYCSFLHRLISVQRWLQSVIYELFTVKASEAHVIQCSYNEVVSLCPSCSSFVLISKLSLQSCHYWCFGRSISMCIFPWHCQRIKINWFVSCLYSPRQAVKNGPS